MKQTHPRKSFRVGWDQKILYLKPEQHELLRSMAKKNGWSVCALIRLAISRMVDPLDVREVGDKKAA